MKIAILPIGYYDGVDRRLSNKGFVSINNVATSIVGKVSMNLTIIDVSNIPNVKNGQEVILYSDISSAKNSVGSAAKLCGTIPYDLLVHITSSTKRLLM
jgi:alanine racemase